MNLYKVKIDSDAFLDIQEARDWYNARVPNLGNRFKKTVKQQINTLKLNANGYSVRYRNVRCMLVEKFSFFVPFRIDGENQIIEVLAIIHTSRGPEIWLQKVKEI